MAKRSEYLESKIKPCESKGKNGKIYKKYVFHFEGKTYSFASYQKTYQTYERLVNGEDIRETKKEDKKRFKKVSVHANMTLLIGGLMDSL